MMQKPERVHGPRGDVRRGQEHTGSCKAHAYGRGKGGGVGLERCIILEVQEPDRLQESLCVCEGTVLQGPGRGQEYGMVQEPTIGSAWEGQ